MKHSNKNFYFLLFVTLMFFLLPQSIQAQNATELRDKIGDRNREIEKLEIEIAAFKKDLANLDKEANTLQSTLKKLDLTRRKLAADIKVTENKIEATNLMIKRLSLDIGDKEGRILNGKAGIAQGLREVSEGDLRSIVEILLSDQSLTEAWNEIHASKMVQANISAKIGELKAVKADLEDNKKETEVAKNKLVFLKDDLSDQRKITDQNTAEKNKLLKQTKNQEANYKKILANKVALRDAFEKELRDYEAQLKFILDPSKLPSGAVFSWPLDYIYITQMFGKTVDSKKLYVSGSHNGTDFRASVGTLVKAMAAGVVLGIGDTDQTCPGTSYGRWVLVRHNNGLTSLYAHLSLIKAVKGSKVATGQILGYSGNTGYSTGPHLHVSIYASSAVQITTLPSRSCGGRTYTIPIAPLNAYLDPLAYLPPYRR